jgi:EAL domain-containing protein (putative c-di-GMP-specific phosphodiesterase class I)
MPDSPEAATLIRTMVDLGSALGLRTIAEGIEHDFQLDHLLREGCERGQGFLFSRAVTPEAIDAILAGDSPADIAALVDEAPAPSPARA